MTRFLVNWLVVLAILRCCVSPARADSRKPLFRDFVGINGHYTFKPDLYRPAARLVRNYHNLNWDVRQPGDAITIPVCVNRVDWNRNVYGPWKKAGFETDICLQFSGFEAGTAGYERFWMGREQWCYDYGKAMAAYFGPSGRERLCTSIEIGNEPGSRFDASLYRGIFRSMAKGIRDGDAGVKIVTPTVHARKGDDYSQDLRGLYADPEILPLYDVINLHTYASIERKTNSESPWNRSYPEDPSIAYLKVVDEAIAWRDEHARGKEIWITEFGYDACTSEAMGRRTDWFLKLNWQGNTDLQQAQYLVRSLFVFAERDVRRAYIYYYDDNDSPSVHGCAGLTRKFVPKVSYYAVRQLQQLLGDYRFGRVVKKVGGACYVYEFQHGEDAGRVIWVVWSPTGARTHEKERYRARQSRVTLGDLPGPVDRVVGMSTTDGPFPNVPYERPTNSTILLTVTESPAYVIFGRR